MKSERKHLGSKCRGSKYPEINCRWGETVAEEQVAGEHYSWNRLIDSVPTDKALYSILDATKHGMILNKPLTVVRVGSSVLEHLILSCPSTFWVML
jgi:hypothetical protein